MNKLKKLMTGIALVGLLSGSAFAQSRVATVDLGKLFDNYWKTKVSRDDLKKRQDDIAKELKDMQDELQKAHDDYQKLSNDATEAAISNDERDRRKKLAEDKLKDMKDKETNIARYQQSSNIALEEMTQRMKTGLIKDIREAVNARAKMAGFALVIDSTARTANDTPIILFNAGDNDLTDQTLAQLNAAAPPEAIKSASDSSTDKPADKK